MLSTAVGWLSLCRNHPGCVDDYDIPLLLCCCAVVQPYGTFTTDDGEVQVALVDVSFVPTDCFPFSLRVIGEDGARNEASVSSITLTPVCQSVTCSVFAENVQLQGITATVASASGHPTAVVLSGVQSSTQPSTVSVSWSLPAGCADPKFQVGILDAGLAVIVPAQAPLVTSPGKSGHAREEL